MANNVRLINMASYVSPKISENTRLSWVEYGDDNNFFQYLIDRYNGSPTNNAIVTGIVDMIFGKGVDAANSSDNPSGYLELRKLIKDEQLKRAVNDFYMLGNAAFQVIYTADKSKIAEVYHFPVETLRAEKCNQEGEVEAYYYAYDWAKVRNKSQAERIPAFGFGAAGEKIEILYIRPYRSGSYYYSPVDYQGGLPYAELEEEIANYHINNIKNGLAPSMIINFNNGIPPQEEQDNIDFAIRQKWSGTSNSGKFILAFNDDANKAATIEPVTLTDAHQQYEFLSKEATQKLIIAHRVTSPMLLGVKEDTGLGNNAEEIKNAYTLFENIVIKPKQEQVLMGIDKILSYNNINLDLYFKPLTPVEFNDVKVQDATTIEKETGVKMSTDKRPFLKEELAASILAKLQDLGENEEELLNDFELVDAEIVEDEEAEYDVEAYLNSRVELAAQDPSTQDTERYKVRYFYAKGVRANPKGSSRVLCSTLINAGRVYRMEDIKALDSAGGAEAQGQSYSVWLYKGGANCYHRWERRVYRKKLTKEGKIYGGGTLNGTDIINVNEAVRQGFKLPKNPKDVAIAPIASDYGGYTADYAREHGIPKSRNIR